MIGRAVSHYLNVSSFKHETQQLEKKLLHRTSRGQKIKDQLFPSYPLLNYFFQHQGASRSPENYLFTLLHLSITSHFYLPCCSPFPSPLPYTSQCHHLPSMLPEMLSLQGCRQFRDHCLTDDFLHFQSRMSFSASVSAELVYWCTGHRAYQDKSQWAAASVGWWTVKKMCFRTGRL